MSAKRRRQTTDESAKHSADACTCGYVETQQQKEENLRHARMQAKLRSVQAQRAQQVREHLGSDGILSDEMCI